MPDLTKQQAAAINAESGNGSITVSAGAGAGKTFVLVNRIINSLKSTPINEYLVVTYTKAAAAEMRQRISSLLEKLIRENPNDLMLQKQQVLLQSTQISTVHSFCKNILGRYYYKLDISPNFRVADTSELDVIKQESLDEVMDMMYDKKNSDFYDFVESFSSEKNDRNMERLIYQLFEFSISHPFPEKWLDDMADMFNTNCDISKTPWGKVIIDYAKDLCDYITKVAEKNYELSLNFEDKYSNCFKADIEVINQVSEVLENGTWRDIFIKLNSVKFVTMARAGQELKEDIHWQNLIRQRDTMKKIFKGLNDNFMFDEEECITAIKELAPVIKQYTETAKLFKSIYSKKKKERNIMDYGDLEHYMLKLLINRNGDKIERTEIADDIAKSFSQIIVDEFQDTNEIQDRIFTEISNGGKNLFVVGDPKQSIYSFRQAKPQIFIGKRDISKPYEAGAKGAVRIDLDKNFRSRPEVIDSCNFICRNIMSRKVGGLDYDIQEELKLGANYDTKDKSKKTELHLLTYDKNMSSAEEAEASYIADRIKYITDNMTIFDNGERRKATYSDICILLRSKKNCVDEYVNVLMSKGIPVINESSGGLLASTEISVTLSFLRTIDNPLNDIPLASVMVCPVYGFTVDELAIIRGKNKDIPLYSNVLNVIESKEILDGATDEIKDKCKHLCDDISYYRKLSATVTIDKLIELLYERSGYQYVVRSMTSSDIRLRNLRKFKEYAASYSQTGGKGLGNFIRFIDLLCEQGKDIDISPVSGEGQNVVKIMSIHASKGLEYPVCILAGCSKEFKNDSDSVIFHSELGLGINRFDKKLKCKQPTFIRKAVAIKRKQDSRSEEIRILYVALTRAREKLIFICSTSNPETSLKSLVGGLEKDKPINSYKVYSSTSYSDMILSCALKCRGCEELREMANVSESTVDTNSPEWQFVSSEYMPSDTIEPKEEVIEKKPVIKDLLNIINSRFSYNYPNEHLTKIPTMVAVSQIAHKNNDYLASNLRKPQFTKGGKLSATERGTATHMFMQHADYILARKDIQTEIDRLVNKKYITQIQADSIDRRKVSIFLKSDLMERMLKSKEIYREFRFSVNISADMADESIQSKENIVMQGAVDCVFIEDGQLVIVDYKTDRIKEPEKFIEIYSRQLELYKTALEKCMDMKAKECIIYSVNLNESIAV